MTFIILDRDGVVNYDSDAYIKSPDEWHPIPGSLEAIAALNQAGFKVLIATNQSGIARGLYDEAMLYRIHAKFLSALQVVGGEITEIFFCPHHPDDDCLCRKPKPGLLHQIQKKYELNLSETFFIGDSYTDIEAASHAGARPILVLTGNGSKTIIEYPKLRTIPHFFDLTKAVEYVLYSGRKYEK